MKMGNAAMKAGKIAVKSRKLLTPQKPQTVKAIKSKSAGKAPIGTKLKTPVPMLKKPAKKRTLLNYF